MKCYLNKHIKIIEYHWKDWPKHCVLYTKWDSLKSKFVHENLLSMTMGLSTTKTKMLTKFGWVICIIHLISFFLKIINQNQHHVIRHITLYVSSTCLFFFLLILASVAYIYLYSQSSLVLEKNILLCLRKIFICLLGYKKKNMHARCSAKHYFSFSFKVT